MFAVQVLKENGAVLDCMVFYQGPPGHPFVVQESVTQHSIIVWCYKTENWNTKLCMTYTVFCLYFLFCCCLFYGSIGMRICFIVVWVDRLECGWRIQPFSCIVVVHHFIQPTALYIILNVTLFSQQHCTSLWTSLSALFCGRAVGAVCLSGNKTTFYLKTLKRNKL